MKLKLLSWTLAAALAIPGLAAGAESDPAKQADIRQLIGGSGTRLSKQLADTAGRTIAAALKTRYPDLPDRVLPALTRELTDVFEKQAQAPGGLTDRIVAIYDKQFTHQEIRELLAFNQTPVGRKTMEVMPQIMGETMAAGQAWGRGLAPEINRRVEAVLKKEGIKAPAKK